MRREVVLVLIASLILTISLSYYGQHPFLYEDYLYLLNDTVYPGACSPLGKVGKLFLDIVFSNSTQVLSNISIVKSLSSSGPLYSWIEEQYTKSNFMKSGIQKPIIYKSIPVAYTSNGDLEYNTTEYWTGDYFIYLDRRSIEFYPYPKSFETLEFPLKITITPTPPSSTTEFEGVVDTSAEMVSEPYSTDFTQWIFYTLLVPTVVDDKLRGVILYNYLLPELEGAEVEERVCVYHPLDDWSIVYDKNSLNNTVVIYPFILFENEWKDANTGAYLWGIPNAGGKITTALQLVYELNKTNGKSSLPSYSISVKDGNYFFYFAQPEVREKVFGEEYSSANEFEEDSICANNLNWKGVVRAGNKSLVRVAFTSDGRPVLVGKVYSNANPVTQGTDRILLPYCPTYVAIKYFVTVAKFEVDPCCGSCHYYEDGPYAYLLTPYVADVCEIVENINTTVKTVKFDDNTYYSAFTDSKDIISIEDYRYPRLYIEFEPRNGFLRKLEDYSDIYVGFTGTTASEIFLKAPMKRAYIPSKDSTEQITYFFSHGTLDFSYVGENLDYMYKTVLDTYNPSKYFVFGYNKSLEVVSNYYNIIDDLPMAYWAYFSGYGFQKIDDLNANITYEMRLKKLIIGNELGDNLTLELDKYIVKGKNLFKHDEDYNYLSLDNGNWYKYDSKPRADIKIPVKFFSEVKSADGKVPLLDLGDKLYLEAIVETNKKLQNKSYVVFSFVGDIDSESIGFVEVLYEDNNISVSTSLENIPPAVNSCKLLDGYLYCYAEIRSSTTNITLLSCEIKEIDENKYKFACLVDTELLALVEPTKNYRAPILDNRFLRVVSFSSSIFPNALNNGIFIDKGPADRGKSDAIRIFDLPFIKDGAAEYLLSYLNNYVAYTKSTSSPSIFVEVYVGVWPGSGEESNYPGNLERLFDDMMNNFGISGKNTANKWGSEGKKLREFLFAISHQSFIPLKSVSIEISFVRLINRLYKLPEAEFNLTIPTGMGYGVTNTTGLLKLKIEDLELCKVRYDIFAYGYECISLDEWEDPKVYCGITETRINSNDYKIWVLDNYLDGKKAIVIYMPWKVSVSHRNVTIKFNQSLKYHFLDASRDTIFKLFNGITGIPYFKGFYLHNYLNISGKKEYFYLIEDNKNGTIVIKNITYLDTYIYLEYDESAKIEEVIIKQDDNSAFIWINDDDDSNDSINVSYNLINATIQLSDDKKHLTYTTEYTVDLSKPHHAFCIIYDMNNKTKKFYRTILDMRYGGYYYGFFYHINYTYIIMAYSKTTPSFTPQTLGLLATVMDLVPWLYAKFMPEWSLKDLSSISTVGLPSRPAAQNVNVSRWVLAVSCPNGICEVELGENCGNCIDCINQSKENLGWTCAYLNPNLNYKDYVELKLCNESVFDETGYIKVAAKEEECNCTAQCLGNNICLYGYCCPEKYPLAIDLNGDGVIDDTEKCIAISADVALVTFTGSEDLVINIDTAKAYNENGIVDDNVKNDLPEEDIIKYAFESNNLTIKNCANFCDSDYLNESDEIQSIIMLYCCKPEIKNETVSSVLSGILGVSCNSDSDCNDNNPCTLDYCWNGKCVYFNLPNGFPVNSTHRCFNGTVAAECVGKLWFDPELGIYRPKAGECGAECEMNGTNDTICLGKGFDMANDSYAIVWTGYCTPDFICEREIHNCYPGCFDPINQSCVENGTEEDVDFDGVNETCINGDWIGAECKGKICGQCVKDSDCIPANITLSDRYILSYLPVCVAGYCKTAKIDCATYGKTPGGCADPIDNICVPNGTVEDIDSDGINETCVIGNWIGAEIYYNYTENKTYVNDFPGECVITEPETNASRYCFYGEIYINDSYYLVGTGVCKENTTCEFIENNVYPGCFYDGNIYDNETLLDVDDDGRPEICINGDWIGAECKGKGCYDDGLECYEDIVAEKVCTGYELINESAYYNYTGKWASPGTCECEKVLVNVYPNCIKPYMYEKFKIEIVDNGTSMNVDADYEEETCVNGRWINAECRIIGNILDCGLGTTYSILVNVTES